MATKIGVYYYMCGPVPSPTAAATSTQHLVLGDSTIFYSTLFDFSGPTFDHPTILSTTGMFPRPTRFYDIEYTVSNVSVTILILLP